VKIQRKISSNGVWCTVCFCRENHLYFNEIA